MKERSNEEKHRKRERKEETYIEREKGTNYRIGELQREGNK